mgnify:CR=1 FL=1
MNEAFVRAPTRLASLVGCPALVALLLWVLLAPFVKLTLGWWDVWFNHGASLEWLAPKR